MNKQHMAKRKASKTKAAKALAFAQASFEGMMSTGMGESLDFAHASWMQFCKVYAEVIES
jgi:hypothetical protein